VRHAFFQFPQPRPELLLDRSQPSLNFFESLLVSPRVLTRAQGTHNRPHNQRAQGEEYRAYDLCFYVAL
jgi:hypothetical protein